MSSARATRGPIVTAIALSMALACGCECSTSARPLDAGLVGDGAVDALAGDAPGMDAALDATASTLPLDDLCAAIVADICLSLIECLGRDYHDAAHCEADQICSRMSDLEMEVAAGWATYDPSAAAACDARFRADPCDFGLFLFVPTVHEVLAYCPGVVTGLQATGEPCASDLDCASTSFCSMLAATCPGSCQPRVGEGGACTFDGTADCDWALTCRRGSCVRHLVAGDACDASTRADCYNDGLWCDTAAGRCLDLVGEGATCDNLNGARCADPFVCVQVLGDPGTCGRPGNAGDGCGVDLDCVEPLTCYQPDFSMLGTCRAPASDGEPCIAPTDCGSAFRCVSDVCVPRDALGEACISEFGADSCGAGLLCDGGICREDRFLGEACDDGTGACVRSLCRSGTCSARAPIGSACVVDDDCASRSCTSGACVDRGSCF